MVEKKAQETQAGAAPPKQAWLVLMINAGTGRPAAVLDPRSKTFFVLPGEDLPSGVARNYSRLPDAKRTTLPGVYLSRDLASKDQELMRKAVAAGREYNVVLLELVVAG